MKEKIQIIENFKSVGDDIIMEKLDKSIIDSFDYLISEGDKILILISELGYTEHHFPESLDGNGVARVNSWLTKCGQFIKNLCTENSIYYKRFESVFYDSQFRNIDKNSKDSIGIVLGIINAVNIDYCSGLLNDVRNLIRAEIFTDFLEMGEYLLNEGYKDAAAVIIGSVLEDTLRKLAIVNDIEILNTKGKFKTIEPLNQELGKEKIYGKLTQKQITSWGDLRNNASHGNYDKYDDEQVKMMLLFVQKFCSEYIS